MQALHLCLTNFTCFAWIWMHIFFIHQWYVFLHVRRHAEVGKN